MKKISITNLKGGTGKTLITFNIATLLAEQYNKKILVIDLDAQHNMTKLLSTRFEKGTEEIFQENIKAEEVIKKSHIENVDIVPTTIKLTGTEIQISSMSSRELILKNWFLDNEDYLSQYDYIFFDTNPTMSIININAFLICDSIALISDIDIDGIDAVDTFIDLYQPIFNRLYREDEVNLKGIIINKVQNTTNMDKDFLEYINSNDFRYKDFTFDSKIRHTVAIRETKLNREPINKERNKKSYMELISLIDELIEKEVL